MAASPGYSTVLKATGTILALTNEAMSLVSGKTYQITNTAKRILDPATALVVQDNGVAVPAASILSIDWMFGTVTFAAAYTVTTPVRVSSGGYLPLFTLATCRSFTFTDSNDLLDKTVFGDTAHKFIQGLQTLTGSVGAIESARDVIDGASRTFNAVLKAGTAFVLEFNPGAGGALFRALVVLEGEGLSSAPTDLVTAALSFKANPQPGSGTSGLGFWASWSWGT